jgi:hypothetical protein
VNEMRVDDKLLVWQVGHFLELIFDHNHSTREHDLIILNDIVSSHTKKYDKFINSYALG